MAIHGSTTAFPVRGLLEFLGTTARTGRLVVQADPQVGLVALRHGRLVAAGLGTGGRLPALVTPTDATTLGGLLVDLVTLPAGRFAFHPDGVHGTDDGFEVAEALAAASALEDEAGALAPERRVHLVTDPDFAAVTVAEDQWEVLACVGGGATVAELASELGLGVPGVRRRLGGIVRLGLARLDEPLDGPPDGPHDGPVDEPAG